MRLAARKTDNPKKARRLRASAAALERGSNAIERQQLEARWRVRTVGAMRSKADIGNVPD